MPKSTFNQNQITFILETCKRFEDQLFPLINNVLVPYYLEREKKEPEIDLEFQKYRRVIRELPDNWELHALMQITVHKIFKKGGRIGPYLRHAEFKSMTASDRDFLHHHVRHPWRFSFSYIKKIIADELFLMQDIFEEDPYLLYSPTVADEINKGPVVMWFNLIYDNGLCRQTFGPIISLRGMQYEDIIYLNSRLCPGMDPDGWYNPAPHIEKNPIPYMLLLAASQTPLVYNKGDQMVLCFSEYDDDSFYTDGLDEYFRIKYSNGLYKLELKRWSGFPHFATAYYSESDETLHLMAMTDRGFYKLVDRLEECGYELEPEPEHRLNPSMLLFVSKMFKKTFSMFGYEEHFLKKTKAQDKATKQVNLALQQLIPYINKGETPDFGQIASETGTNADELREIFTNLSRKIGK